IVLNSLAEEQTGANLHRGTGSFVKALDTHGLPGFFSGDKSPQSVQLEEWGPLYLAESDTAESSKDAAGGNEDQPDRERIIDYELESYHRFLLELGRLHAGAPLPDIVGEVAFDDLKRVPEEPPLLTPTLQETLRRIAPQLRQPTTRVEIIVWSTTPSPSAWERAALQAQQLRQEALAFLQLDARTADRLTSAAKTWISSTVARPGTSIVLRRTKLVLPNDQ
ncbi:MAG: hypothetical protein ACK5Q5_16235, partial [Planctomycetaceae bacterium]